MRIGIAGKGGVGKSLVAALMARLLARSGREVLAVDCDSDPHLALTAGVPLDRAETMRPLLEQHDRGRRLASGRDPVLLAEEHGLDGPDGVRFVLAARSEEAGSG